MSLNHIVIMGRMTRDPELRMIRAQRLAAWRDLSLKSAAAAIGEEKLIADFRNFAVKQFGAAFQLLCGGEPPKLKSAKGGEIIVRTMPGLIGLGCIGEELRPLAKEALGYICNEYWCFDECGTNYYYFDGQRSVSQVALAVWSTRPYGIHEKSGRLRKGALPSVETGGTGGESGQTAGQGHIRL